MAGERIDDLGGLTRLKPSTFTISGRWEQSAFDNMRMLLPVALYLDSITIGRWTLWRKRWILEGDVEPLSALIDVYDCTRASLRVKKATIQYAPWWMQILWGVATCINTPFVLASKTLAFVKNVANRG